MAKGILFLSILDFTDKGIQVVRLTPQYFAKKGWDVHYVVTRDNLKNSSFNYQDTINPIGVNVHRYAMPSWRFGEKIKHHILKTIYSKLRGYAAILKLAWKGRKVLKKNNIDVIYGGGPHGVLAARLLFFCGGRVKKVLVSRFYGTFLAEKIINRNWFGVFLNWDELLAFRIQSNLMIVTNDGTHGDIAAKRINSQWTRTLRFWVNGVDFIDAYLDSTKGNPAKNISAITICRLVSWKRVDRAIRCVADVVIEKGFLDFRYNVVGDGPEIMNLKQLACELGIENKVVFHGAVNHSEASKLIVDSDIYISTYDLSNVGNPLLEAIRANRVIFTLNNGDTGSWIKHEHNGFIYDVDELMIKRMVDDMIRVIESRDLRETIKRNLKITEQEKLWTWDERLDTEFSEIDRLVVKNITS